MTLTVGECRTDALGMEARTMTERLTGRSLAAYIRENGIRATSEWADENPNMDDDARYPMTHYRVTLRAHGRRMVVPFSMGMAHTDEPSADDVLDCLASDAAGFENAQGFEDWAAEYGFDTDSRKAERTYRAIERQTTRLRAFLGDAAYSALLWDTERL